MLYTIVVGQIDEFGNPDGGATPNSLSDEAIGNQSSGRIEWESIAINIGVPSTVIFLFLFILRYFTPFYKFFDSIGDSLLPGTPSAAENYSLGNADPLDRFRNHLHRVLEATHKPILLIIDDIDRCDPDFVVSLVQGLQTVMRSPRLQVVILGHRHWIERCFALEFKDMSDNQGSRNSELGRKFVEKALQMSLTLPSPTVDQKRKFLDLIGNQSEVNGAAKPNLDSVVSSSPQPDPPSGMEDEVPFEYADPPRQEKWLEAIELAQNSAEDQRIEVSIAQFAHLFPANPRMMKRIVNSVSFYRAVALGMGEIIPAEDRWSKLILWIIISMTHVDAWARISADPALLARIRAGKDELANDRRLLELLNAVRRLEPTGGTVTEDDRDFRIEAEDVHVFRRVVPPPEM